MGRRNEKHENRFGDEPGTSRGKNLMQEVNERKRKEENKPPLRNDEDELEKDHEKEIVDLEDEADDEDFEDEDQGEGDEVDIVDEKEEDEVDENDEDDEEDDVDKKKINN